MAKDEELVKRAIKGNDQAFLQLMKQYKVDLYKTALSFLKNEDEAIEAIQEVTYRAYKNIQKVKEPAYFKTWLIRIMINYCNDQIEKRKRMVLNDEMINSKAVTEDHLDLEMKDIMLSLDGKSREILTLKYFHGLKIKEIANIMECPEGTVKTWLNKALSALRTKLDEKGGM